MNKFIRVLCDAFICFIFRWLPLMLLGFIVFTIAFNCFPDWRKFTVEDFGDFESISTPQHYAFSTEELLRSMNTDMLDSDRS